MTSDVETFWSVAASRGAPTSTLPEPVQRAYLYWSRAAQDLIQSARSAYPKLPPIHLEFVINPAINAFAFRLEDRYFIGVHTATVVMLHFVVSRMLSDSRTFTHIGDPSKEVGALEPIKDFVPNADELVRTNALTTPRDPVRAAFARYLTEQAFLFLVGHELAHISRGHVGYLFKLRSVSVVPEIIEAESSAHDIVLERQCLEQDADMRSIGSRIDSLKTTFGHASFSGLPWRENSQDIVTAIGDWSASIHILFRLFGDHHLDSSKLTTSYYPPFPIRLFCMKMAAAFATEQLFQIKPSEGVFKALRQSESDVEKAFDVILGRSVRMTVENEEVAKQAQAHAGELLKLFDVLVPQLRPFSVELS